MKPQKRQRERSLLAWKQFKTMLKHVPIWSVLEIECTNLKRVYRGLMVICTREGSLCESAKVEEKKGESYFFVMSFGC